MEQCSGSSPHQPLNENDSSEIRVVKLQPGKWDEPISCELSHISLAAEPEYTALSYAWGDPRVTRDINLNGVPYPVTINLFLALQHLRERTSGHLFWIDALCINQQDKIERAAQVQRMTEIYRVSQILLIYVGEVDEHEKDEIQQLFKRAKQVAAACRYNIDTLAYLDWSTKREHLKELRMENDIQIDKILRKFTERPWFSRVWVVQEVAYKFRHAGVICGNLAIDLKHLLLLEDIYRAGSKGIQTYRNAFSPGTQMIAKVAVKVTRAAVDPGFKARFSVADNLIWLLRHTSLFKATEARDKIYALLGMCTTDPVPSELVPSYECSIESVYHAYTKYLIEQTGYFPILAANRIKAPHIPSWVVDLELHCRHVSPLAHPSNVSFSSTGYVMNAQGFRYGRSVHEHNTKRIKGGIDDMINPLTDQLRRIEHYVFKRCLKLHESYSREDLIKPVLEQCVNICDHKVDDIFETYNFLVNFRASEYQEGQHIPTLDSNMLSALSVLTWFNYVVYDTGKIGSIVNYFDRGAFTKRGDIVCLLKGSEKSLILRENIESDTYELITSCSVPDIDPEYYVEESAWAGVPLETFAIA